MPHVHRFHISPETRIDPEILLPSEEAHHALHVVRVREGERVVLFDGEGREIDGSVLRATHREVVIAPESERQIPAPAVRLTLLQAWLLREKSIEYLIQHGTEIGISHFCFFRGRHSEKAPRLNPKWRRCAVETCKQCGRAWLPTFEAVPDLKAALGPAQGPILIATQSLATVEIAQALHESGKCPANVTLIVGPEGDFAPEELQAATDNGAVAISLGSATYRSEVAATLAASLILYELDAL